jgi:hypothetical protein
MLVLGIGYSTWILFGPIAGFHHLYVFGVFGYMGLDGDGPDPSLPRLCGFGVVFRLVEFAMSILAWLLVAVPLIFGTLRASKLRPVRP